MPDKFLGVVPDPRSEVEKAQDWQHDEIVAAASGPVTWVEKPIATLRRFPKRNQVNSLSCMAQSGAKALGIENVVEEGTFVELSALPVYRARSNFPSGGMFQQNLFSILSKPTACLEKDMPSQEMSEQQMNTASVSMTDSMKQLAEYYRANGYMFLPAGNIDQMAVILDQGKAVHLLMYFMPDEWWRPYPTIIYPGLPNDPIASHHGITAVDRTLWEGKKALFIEDSAGNDTSIGGTGQRILNEDFLMQRCYGAGYLLFKKNADSTVPKPKHYFNPNRPLFFGIMNDNEVMALQKILQYESFLPYTLNGNLLPLGNMLQMTCTGLKKWQVKHGIMDFATEPDVRKVRFGPKSIGLANSLYA